MDRSRSESRRSRRRHAPKRAWRRPEPQFPLALEATERLLRVRTATAVGARGADRARADLASASASDNLVPPTPRHGLGLWGRPASRESVRPTIRASLPPDATTGRKRDLLAEQHPARNDRLRG